MLDSILWSLLITLYFSRLGIVIAFLYHFSGLGPSRAWADALRAMIQQNPFTSLFQLMGVVGLWGISNSYAQNIQKSPFELLLWMMILCVLDLSVTYFIWTAERNIVLRAIQSLILWIMRR